MINSLVTAQAPDRTTTFQARMNMRNKVKEIIGGWRMEDGRKKGCSRGEAGSGPDNDVEMLLLTECD